VSATAVAPDADVAGIVLWQLLALSVSTPTRASLDEVDALAAALEERPGAPSALASLRAAIAGTSPDELGRAQQRLFGGKVAVAPYEGSYEDDPFRQARQMSDVAGFYRAFGAEARGPAHERPDHAGCELEFLAFLGARRVAAVEAGHDADADLCLEIEEAFLRDHAGRWLPSFFRALERKAPDSFHGALGRLGADGVESELARRGIEAEPLGPRARRLSVEADELECAAGTEPVTPLLPGSRRRRRAR
jgi:TorA maturation chaperone TorD